MLHWKESWVLRASRSDGSPKKWKQTSGSSKENKCGNGQFRCFMCRWQQLNGMVPKQIQKMLFESFGVKLSLFCFRVYLCEEASTVDDEQNKETSFSVETLKLEGCSMDASVVVRQKHVWIVYLQVMSHLQTKERRTSLFWGVFKVGRLVTFFRLKEM